jgi:hypothetical protein
MNFTTTKTKGWQQHCWEWAEAKEPFELRDVAAENIPFCNELCAAYQGKYQLSNVVPVATFTFIVEEQSLHRNQNKWTH